MSKKKSSKKPLDAQGPRPVRTTVMLDDEVWADLLHFVAARKVEGDTSASASRVIREAVREYLDRRR